MGGKENDGADKENLETEGQARGSQEEGDRRAKESDKRVEGE